MQPHFYWVQDCLTVLPTSFECDEQKHRCLKCSCDFVDKVKNGSEDCNGWDLFDHWEVRCFPIWSCFYQDTWTDLTLRRVVHDWVDCFDFHLPTFWTWVNDRNWNQYVDCHRVTDEFKVVHENHSEHCLFNYWTIGRNYLWSFCHLLCNWTCNTWTCYKCFSSTVHFCNSKHRDLWHICDLWSEVLFFDLTVLHRRCFKKVTYYVTRF